MRTLSSVERGGLCLGVLLSLVGIWLALFPRESAGYIASDDNGSYLLISSKQECRVYGVITLSIIGAALGSLAVYPLKRRDHR